jgi:hypothetical protein
MNNDIKPIETIYNGYRFRSRLEARWAVFFDAMNIQWEYEPEGFVLSNGEKYLPDFYLPTFNGGMYVEVKHEGGDFSKALMFAKDAGTLVWLAEGMPDLKEYNIACSCERTDEWIPHEESQDVLLVSGIPNFSKAYTENRMYWFPEFCCSTTGAIPPDMIWDDIENQPFCWAEDLLNAVKQARSARFEFGENDWVR